MSPNSNEMGISFSFLCDILVLVFKGIWSIKHQFLNCFKMICVCAGKNSFKILINIKANQTAYMLLKTNHG